MAILVNLGVLFSFLSLKRRLRALKTVKSKDSAKKDDGGFSINQEDAPFRIIYKRGLRSKFCAL